MGGDKLSAFSFKILVPTYVSLQLIVCTPDYLPYTCLLYTSPVYENTGLPGAVFDIAAAEDIYTPDGTLRAKAGDIVDTVTTQSDGMAASKALYLGKYVITEKKAPHGMALQTEPHTVELVYAGQEVTVTELRADMYNERQLSLIHI